MLSSTCFSNSTHRRKRVMLSLQYLSTFKPLHVQVHDFVKQENIVQRLYVSFLDLSLSILYELKKLIFWEFAVKFHNQSSHLKRGSGGSDSDSPIFGNRNHWEGTHVVLEPVVPGNRNHLIPKFWGSGFIFWIDFWVSEDHFGPHFSQFWPKLSSICHIFRLPYIPKFGEPVIPWNHWFQFQNQMSSHSVIPIPIPKN